MNSSLHRRVFRCFTSLALVATLLFPSIISAQKGRTKTAKDELTILKKLPDFFINDAFLPAKLKGVYRRDAARLAIRLIDKEQRASAQTVEIPEQLVQATPCGANRPLGVERDVGNDCVGRKSAARKIRNSPRGLNFMS